MTTRDLPSVWRRSRRRSASATRPLRPTPSYGSPSRSPTISWRNRMGSRMLNPSRTICRLAMCVALALPGISCVKSLGSLSVNITKECKRLPGHVPPPAIEDDTDYRALSAEALGGLKNANRHNAAIVACYDRVIAAYEKAGNGL